MIIHKILLSLLFFVTFSPDFEVSFAKAQNTKENILVFGGTSGTGLAAVKFLSKKNIPITVFVRPTSNLKNIRSFNVDFFIGDQSEVAAWKQQRASSGWPDQPGNDVQQAYFFRLSKMN